MELLEWLRESVDCEYISDMRFGTDNKLAATMLLKDIDFSKYTPDEISDAASYICGKDIKFNTIEDARNFFCNDRSKG